MILLLGKSGSGKDTVQKELMALGVLPAIPCTTRPPRDGEQDGVHYHFLTEEDFIRKRDMGMLAVHNSYTVASGDVWRYGFETDALTKECMLQTNPCQIKELLGMTELVPVAFYLDAAEDVLYERRLKRGAETKAEIMRRMETDREDFRSIKQHADYTFRTDCGMSPHLIAKSIRYLHSLYIDQ